MSIKRTAEHPISDDSSNPSLPGASAGVAAAAAANTASANAATANAATAGTATANTAAANAGTNAAAGVIAIDQLAHAVEVMDRLYSPGGCPWDRTQTHTTLVPYLLEEAHELAEAIETGDSAAMREELGDVLLQVLFHARIAQEETERFGINDVAAGLVDKLIRRHPHVFAGQEVSADLHAQWDEIKKKEKQRTSVLEGIALNQGALARAQKVIARAERAGIDTRIMTGERAGVDTRIMTGERARTAMPDAAGSVPGIALAGTAPGGPAAPTDRQSAQAGPGSAREPVLANASTAVGQELLEIVRKAQAQGIDAESALRTALRGVELVIVQREQNPAE